MKRLNYPIRKIEMFTNKKGERKTHLMVDIHEDGELFTAPTLALPTTSVLGINSNTPDEILDWIEKHGKNEARKHLARTLR